MQISVFVRAYVCVRVCACVTEVLAVRNYHLPLPGWVERPLGPTELLIHSILLHSLEICGFLKVGRTLCLA